MHQESLSNPDSISSTLIENNEFTLVMETNKLSLTLKLLVKVSEDKTDMYQIQINSLENNYQLYDKFDSVEDLASYIKNPRNVEVSVSTRSIKILGKFSRNQNEVSKIFQLGQLLLEKVDQKDLNKKCLQDLLKKIQTEQKIEQREMRKYLKVLIKSQLDREKQVQDIMKAIQKIQIELFDIKYDAQKKNLKLNQKIDTLTETIRIGSLQQQHKEATQNTMQGQRSFQQSLLPVKKHEENPLKWNIRLWIDTEGTNMNKIDFDDNVIVALNNVQIFMTNKVQGIFEMTFVFMKISHGVSLGVIDSLNKTIEAESRNNHTISYWNDHKIQIGHRVESKVGHGFKMRQPIRLCVDTNKGLISWIMGSNVRHTLLDQRLANSNIRWVPFLKLRKSDAVQIKGNN